LTRQYVRRQTFSWIFGLLMLVVCYEVAKRYLLNSPDAWVFDVTGMMYGAGFMMCGAYTLAQNAHVRGDFLYGSMRPRTQATLDLALYILFFIPGITALVFAGWDFDSDSWAIHEHSSTSSDGPPMYHFKTLIPIAGGLVLLQGLAEMARCVVCLRTGEWPSRLKDAEEIDVVEQQLSSSTYVDEASKRDAIAKAHNIEEEAHQRNKSEKT
jgi:TRAP-type mannitol/chloroaromatic compound transport system permease small subunit